MTYPLVIYPKSPRCFTSPFLCFSFSFSFTSIMLAASPTPSFPGAWPDWNPSDDVPPLPDKYVPPDTALEDDVEPTQDRDALQDRDVAPQHRDALHDRDVPQDRDALHDRDAPPKDASPSPLCLSPRPLPELPSLSSSFSTADSSITNDSSTPPTSPDQPCSPIDMQQPICTPPRTQSPILLDLREPRSPDSAHFSPAIDAFSSPSSSRLQLSLSNNCPGARSVESIGTYHPSRSSTSIPDDERSASQDEQGHTFPAEEVTFDMDLLRSQGEEQEQTFHGAKISVGKRTFLGRMKRFGGRVRKLFKPRIVEARPRHNGVSTRKPPLPVTLRLSESPKNRQESEGTHFITRRFSLQSLLHSSSRLPPGSDDSNSRATASRRLSTVVSAHESLQDTRLLDATTTDGIVYQHVHPDRDHHEQATNN